MEPALIRRVRRNKYQILELDEEELVEPILGDVELGDLVMTGTAFIEVETSGQAQIKALERARLRGSDYVMLSDNNIEIPSRHVRRSAYIATFYEEEPYDEE